jgi:hypothetical protein
MMTEVPDPETTTAFNNNVVDEFRANGGKVGAFETDAQRANAAR